MISVIIPAHNAAEVLSNQLDALCRQINAPTFQVIVVANCCTDNTASLAYSYSDKLDLRVLVADQRRSAAYARNQGARIATGSVLLFCDADDRAGPGWVAGMANALANERADFVGGRISVVRDELPNWLYRWSYSSIDGRCFIDGPSLPHVLSASLGVTTKAFSTVGGFDESFDRAAGEDTDISHRLLRAGYRLACAPSAMMHYTPRRSMKGALAQKRNYAQGALRLNQKEGRLPKRPSVVDGFKGLFKGVLRAIIREGEFHPLFLYARGRSSLSGWIDHRRMDSEVKKQSPVRIESSEFAIDPSIPLIGGLAFVACNPNEALWYSRRGVEREALKVLDHLLPAGGTFVDVGANVGLFSVAAARKVGSEGRIFAFEPGVRAREALERNLLVHAVLADVEVRAEAVGEKSGSATFREYENPQVSGFGYAPAAFSPGELLSEDVIPVVCLSDAVAGPVNMIKIDVEGFEADVLRGATVLLDQSPDVILLFEINPTSTASAGRSLHELSRILGPDEWVHYLVGEDSEAVLPSLRRVALNDFHSFIPDDRGWFGMILAARKSSGLPSLDGHRS